MKNNVVKNTSWLFIFQIAKIVFPLITLPYLTRILSTETYGIVTYVRSVMLYMQILVDFGFVLSGTKEIVKLLQNKDKKQLNKTIGDTMLARIFLGIIGFLIVIVLSLLIPILRDNFLYTLLSYIVVFESIFLFDFIFRGYEKMHVIAVRFILMKTISTVLTFILIKDDSYMILIPVLDVISSFIAIILAFIEVKKLNISFKITKISNIFNKIKDSFTYFLSDVASTSFNAFSTIIIGIYLTRTDIAFWGICMQIIGTIQALYNPITGGIYPEMVKTKNIGIIKKTLKIFLPIVILGCILTYFLSPLAIKILGGEKYVLATPILRLLIPCLLFGFVATMLGWPTLGAIGKQKEVTISTVFSVVVNILLLVVLLVFNKFTLFNIAVVRIFTDMILFMTRFYFYEKNKKLFVS